MRLQHRRYRPVAGDTRRIDDIEILEARTLHRNDSLRIMPEFLP